MYLGHKFLCSFIKQNTRFAFSQILSKNCNYYVNIFFQSKYIASEILYDSMQWNPSQNYHMHFGKTEQKRPLLHPNCTIFISNDIYFAYNFLCNFILQKPRSRIPKIREKVKLQRHLLTDFYQKLININLCQYATIYNFFYEILCISSPATLGAKFLSHRHRQTDIFQKYNFQNGDFDGITRFEAS